MKNKKKYYISSNHQSIHYTKVSSKSNIAIFYLHGLMSDITGKKVRFLKSFCKKKKINFLAFDYSGHGKSSGNFENQGIDDWVKEAYEICQSMLKNKKIILVGSSCGGWIAAILIWKLKNILGFVGISSAPDFTKYLMWNTFSNKTKKIINSGKIYKLKSDYDGFYPIGKTLIKSGNDNLILHKKILCNFPIRLIHGLKDKIVPAKYSYFLSKTIVSKDTLILIQNDGEHSLSSKKDLKRIVGEIISIANLKN